MAAPRPYGLRSLGHSAAPFTFHPDPFGVQDAESDNNMLCLMMMFGLFVPRSGYG